jgi:hypothetical protein
MREILFRGKAVEDLKWVEGFYFREAGEFIKELPSAVTTPTHLVYPETIGQYTGLTDKNGTKIFEGDIFLDRSDDAVSVVVFKDGCFRLEWYGMCGTYTESGYDECGGGWDVFECDPIDWYNVHDMEVTDNIHDNPELLGG